MQRAEGIQSINWIAPDAQAAERFYTEVLGGTIRLRHQVRGTDVVRVQVGDTGIGLFDGSAGPVGGVPHHTFRMSWPATVAEARTTLEQRGAAVLNERVHGDGPGFSLYVFDPMGHYLELSYDPPS